MKNYRFQEKAGRSVISKNSTKVWFGRKFIIFGQNRKISKKNNQMEMIVLCEIGWPQKSPWVRMIWMISCKETIKINSKTWLRFRLIIKSNISFSSFSHSFDFSSSIKDDVVDIFSKMFCEDLWIFATNLYRHTSTIKFARIEPLQMYRNSNLVHL